MSLEKFEFPSAGTVTETWAPSANPTYPDFVNGRDLGISQELSAGNTSYHFGSAVHVKTFARSYMCVSEADRASFENFISVVGGGYFKFTDERGVPHRVKFDRFTHSWRDAYRDTWNFGFTLREEQYAPPSLAKIASSWHRDLLLYAPLTGPAMLSNYFGALACVRNTIATYIDPADGLVKQVAANAPRFEANGLLIEPARTNYCLHSADFSNAAWVKTTVTVAANDAGTLAPDGTQTADSLTASAGNGTVLQAITLASAAKVFSLYLKRKTGTGNVDITLDNGSTWATVTINSSTWTRVVGVQTLPNPTVGLRIVTNADAVWAWGGQLEDGASFATSYIPTTTAAVARSADDLRIAEAGHILPAAGTLICSVDVLATDAGADAYQFIDAATLAGGTGLELVSDSNAVRARVFSGGSAVASLTGGAAFVAGTPKKIGLAWQANDFRLVVDGAQVAADTAGAAPTALQGTSLWLGQRSDATRRLAGHIKDLTIFPKALTNAEIITIQAGF